MDDKTIHFDYGDFEIPLEIVVNLESYGRYIPASRYEPAEYPEVEWSIDTILYKGELVNNIKAENMARIEAVVERELEDLELI